MYVQSVMNEFHMGEKKLRAYAKTIRRQLTGNFYGLYYYGKVTLSSGPFNLPFLHFSLQELPCIRRLQPNQYSFKIYMSR